DLVLPPPGDGPQQRSGMSDHYDSLESRDPAAREADLFARLPAAIAQALTAPGWAKQLAGVDPEQVASRAALSKLPLLRKSDLVERQRATPPFGGYNTLAPGKARRLPLA